MLQSVMAWQAEENKVIFSVSDLAQTSENCCKGRVSIKELRIKINN